MSQGLNQVPAASERISPIIHWEDCCASQQKSMPPPSQGLSQLLISALSKKKRGGRLSPCGDIKLEEMDP